jgi:hypothetical protein
LLAQVFFIGHLEDQLVIGIALHYRGNFEFELEMYPVIAGVELVRKP